MGIPFLIGCPLFIWQNGINFVYYIINKVMKEQYAKQIIEWAEEAKQYLTIRKEIILDENTTDQQLGSIIRQMYNSKVQTQNETIENTKQNTK
jgi:hypothetical protein